MRDSVTPLFAAASRMFVHYKFKTRMTFDAQRLLRDDDYARNVLVRVRAVGDRKLDEMAHRFELERFKAAPAREPRKGDPAEVGG